MVARAVAMRSAFLHLTRAFPAPQYHGPGTGPFCTLSLTHNYHNRIHVDQVGVWVWVWVWWCVCGVGVGVGVGGRSGGVKCSAAHSATAWRIAEPRLPHLPLRPSPSALVPLSATALLHACFTRATHPL